MKPRPSGAPPVFEPTEILAAVAFALGIMVATFGMLSVIRLEKLANAPAISPVAALPVRVTPVLDLDAPALKLGGGQKLKMPDQWKLPTLEQIAERHAFVSAKAQDKASAIPPKDLKVADAGTKPPPPDAGPPAPSSTAAVGSAVAAADGPEGPSDGGDAPPGPGSPLGVASGKVTDGGASYAIAAYRSRLIGWFSGRFRVSGTGLPPEELSKLGASAVVTIGADLTVQSYSFTPSGNAAIDAAAKAALDGAVGQQVPPPPEDYPEAVQSQLSLFFKCSPSRCN